MAIADVLGRLQRVKPTGPRKWRALCPGHDDSTPSLDIEHAQDGKVLLICRASCKTEAVMKAAGIEWDDMFEKGRDEVPKETTPPAFWPVKAVYTYCGDRKSVV